MVAALPCLIGGSHSALPLFALVLGVEGYEGAASPLRGLYGRLGDVATDCLLS